MDRYEKAFIMACIDIKAEKDWREANKLKR